MSKMSRTIVWICSKFSRQEIEKIIGELSSIVKDPSPMPGLRDEFKEQHPNYRNFDPDPTEPLTEPPVKKRPKKL